VPKRERERKKERERKSSSSRIKTSRRPRPTDKRGSSSIVTAADSEQAAAAAAAAAAGDGMKVRSGRLMHLPILHTRGRAPISRGVSGRSRFYHTIVDLTLLHDIYVVYSRGVLYL